MSVKIEVTCNECEAKMGRVHTSERTEFLDYTHKLAFFMDAHKHHTSIPQGMSAELDNAANEVSPEMGILPTVQRQHTQPEDNVLEAPSLQQPGHDLG